MKNLLWRIVGVLLSVFCTNEDILGGEASPSLSSEKAKEQPPKPVTEQARTHTDVRAQEKAQEQEDVRLTVYDSNFAFIRDTHPLDFHQGLQEHTFQGMSQELIQGTLLMRVLPRTAGILIREQSFHLDPTTTQPSMWAVFESPRETTSRVELSYVTSGMNWTASYTAEVNEADDSVDLLGLATIHNRTLVNFHKAQVLLVATPSQSKQGLATQSGSHKQKLGPVGTTAARSEQVQNGDIALKAKELSGETYTLPHLIDLGPHQSKSVVFVQANGVLGERQFWLVIDTVLDKDTDGAIQSLPVTTMVSIENVKSTGLGMPLPRGNLFVYHKAGSDCAKVSDQTRLGHMAMGSKIPLRLGDAEGVEATLQQTDFKKLGPKVLEVGYRVVLKNKRDKLMTIRVLNALKVPQADVDVIRENHKHKKENGLLWTLDIPPRDQQELRYRLRMTYPHTGE